MCTCILPPAVPCLRAGQPLLGGRVGGGSCGTVLLRRPFILFALFALASRATSTSRRWRHVPRHRRDAPRRPGPGNSIIVKNVPRSTNADVWDEWADEDEDDDFLSPEMRERLKALDAETAPPVDKCPIQHDLGDDDALKCSKDWVNAIVSDAGICPFSLSAAVHESNRRGSSTAVLWVHPTH